MSDTPLPIDALIIGGGMAGLFAMHALRQAGHSVCLVERSALGDGQSVCAQGIVHGGVWCSMVESLASVSAYVWLSANGGGNVVGVNNNTDFLRAVTGGKAYGAAEPVHRGRRQQLWLVTIRDDRDRLIARGHVRLQNLPADS